MRLDGIALDLCPLCTRRKSAQCPLSNFYHPALPDVVPVVYHCSRFESDYPTVNPSLWNARMSALQFLVITPLAQAVTPMSLTLFKYLCECDKDAAQEVTFVL